MEDKARISVTELSKLKKKVDRYGRMKMSRKIGIPYMTLSGKLSGVSSFFESELSAIGRVLNNG